MPIARLRLLALSSLLVAACGIDLVGTGAGLDGGADAEAPDGMVPDGESPDVVVANDGQTPTDAGADADADAEIEAGPPDACAATCPATTVTTGGFAPVLLGDGTAACPSGFDPTDYVENPTANAGSCKCAPAAITANCNNGNIMSLDGTNANNCTSDGASASADGNCDPENGESFSTNFVTFTAPKAIGVACTAAGQPDPTQVTKPVRRVCTPQPATCAGSLCGDANTNFQVCSASMSDAGCPPALPARHVLGKASDITLTCADCQCTNPSATCTGTMTYYANSNCTGTAKAITAGTCTNVGKDSFNSLKWAGTVVPGTATTTPAQSATLTMAATGVVCCAN